jgi:hypothetical protein
VPSLSGRHATRLTALHPKLDAALDRGAVAIARMRVAAAGAPGRDRDGEQDRFLPLIVLDGALE